MINQTEQTTEQRVREILADRSGKPIEIITLHTPIQQDLELDSLDFVETIMEFDTAFGISIPDERAEKVVTVQDAVTLIDELLQEKK